MATPINFVLPDSGPFRFIHEQFRNNKRFADEIRNGGAIVVLSMTKPIIKVKVAADGKHCLPTNRASMRTGYTAALAKNISECSNAKPNPNTNTTLENTARKNGHARFQNIDCPLCKGETIQPFETVYDHHGNSIGLKSEVKWRLEGTTLFQHVHAEYTTDKDLYYDEDFPPEVNYCIPVYGLSHCPYCRRRLVKSQSKV